jgi:hypothetical protein
MRFTVESGLQLLSYDFHKHTLNQDLWDLSLMHGESNVNTRLSTRKGERRASTLKSTWNPPPLTPVSWHIGCYLMFTPGLALTRRKCHMRTVRPHHPGLTPLN